MITRQRILLRVVDLEGGVISKLRLVKLAFLFRATSEDAPTSAAYEFLPYLFGPYSFTLGHELRTLERDGWLRVDDHEIRANRSLSAETAKLDKCLCYGVESLVTRYRSTSTNDLVSEVYRRFPWYTANAQNARRRAVSIPNAERAIY